MKSGGIWTSTTCILYILVHLFRRLVGRALRNWLTSACFLLFAVLFRVKLIEAAGQVQDERNEAKPDLVLLVARLDGALLHPLDEGREQDEVCTGESVLVWKHLEKLARHPLLHKSARHPEHHNCHPTLPPLSGYR